VIADGGWELVAGGGVDGGGFAEDVVVADFDAGGVAGEFEVLGFEAETDEGVEEVVASEDDSAVEVDISDESSSWADDGGAVDVAEGTDFGVVGELSGGVDEGGGVGVSQGVLRVGLSGYDKRGLGIIEWGRSVVMVFDGGFRGLMVRDVGRVSYVEGYGIQKEVHDGVVSGVMGETLILAEHDPVITVSPRRSAWGHLLAGREELERLGIEVQETDRGGDITYHGPGQLVAYPILSLGLHGLNLGRYMRLLEEVVIEAVRGFGIEGVRREGLTGVWVEGGG
jgi:hypothetical protein